MSSGAADSRTGPRVDAVRVAHSAHTQVDRVVRVRGHLKGEEYALGGLCQTRVVPELVSFVAEIK
jgi:hypothetical protein